MLRRICVSVLAVLSMLTLALTTGSAAFADPVTSGQPPSGYPTSQVMASFGNAFGQTLYIRRGFWDANIDQGFGYDKAYNKHGITHVDAQKFVLKSPNRIQDGNQYRYTAYARKIVNGQVVEQVEVRGFYDYRNFPTYFGWPAGNPLGLVTMYCWGFNPRCPSWVTTALRNGLSSAVAGATTSLVAGYTKMSG